MFPNKFKQKLRKTKTKEYVVLHSYTELHLWLHQKQGVWLNSFVSKNNNIINNNNNMNNNYKSNVAKNKKTF